VDDEVEGNGNPRDRGLTNELGVAKNHGHRVVVDVQEFELLFLEDEKDGINKLPVLDKVVEIIENLKLFRPRVLVAHRVKDAMIEDNRK